MDRIHSIVDVAKGESCNSAFSGHVVVLSTVENICSHSHLRSVKGLDAYLDNAYPNHSRQSNDCLRATKVWWAAQPGHNPDVGLSDFFLSVCQNNESKESIIRPGRSSKNVI
jgi:hypothetical protein